MFKWLNNVLDNARIALAYIGYERKCRTLWLADAERTYSTAQVDQEIERLMSKPLSHVESAFDAPIRALTERQLSVKRMVAEAQHKLAVFQRDYKSELDAAYAELNEVREKLNTCRENLSSAFDDLKSAKRSLDSWYSRAEGSWLGNGGKKLPRYAFFGQDLSDRDYYKRKRDGAAALVGIHKSERYNLEQRLNSARSSIQRIKDARQTLFELKKQGFDKRVISGMINNGNADLRVIDSEITSLQDSRADYIRQAKDSLGVFALEKEVVRLNQEKNACIKAFESEPLVAKRKAKHRADWLASRGR